MQLRTYLPLVLATALLALAPPASAIFVETPLHLTADDPEPEVGGSVRFDGEAANNMSRENLAGKHVIIRWSMYDENGSTQDPKIIRDDLVLDDEARLSFTWTIPGEADDRNVFVTIEEGREILGQVHLLVGDAPPMIMAMSDMGPEEPAPSDPAQEAAETQPADVPAPGPLAAVLVIALVGFLVRRRY